MPRPQFIPVLQSNSNTTWKILILSSAGVSVCCSAMMRVDKSTCADQRLVSWSTWRQLCSNVFLILSSPTSLS